MRTKKYSPKKILKVIHDIKDCSGINGKKDILLTHTNNTNLVTVLKYAYDDINYKFGVKTLPTISEFKEDVKSNWLDILEMLLKGRVTGNDRKEYLLTELTKSTLYNYELLQLILDRTLRNGLKATSINEVVGRELIPIFEPLKPRGDYSKIRYPVYVDLKYNGIRLCSDRVGGVWSLKKSGGKSVDIPSAVKELEELVPISLGDVRLDGELKVKESYFKIKSGFLAEDKHRLVVSALINSHATTNTPLTDEESLKKFEIRIFDIIPYQETKMTKKELVGYAKSKPLSFRRLKLLALFSKVRLLNHTIKIGTTKKVKNLEGIATIFKDVISKGGEGIIWKNIDSKYHLGVTQEWGKMKARAVADLEVIGFSKGNDRTKNAGKITSLLCATSCRGLITSVGSGLKQQDIDFSDIEEYEGKIVEVHYVNTIQDDRGVYSLFNPSFRGGSGSVSNLQASIRDDKTKALTLEEVLITEKESNNG